MDIITMNGTVTTVASTCPRSLGSAVVTPGRLRGHGRPSALRIAASATDRAFAFAGQAAGAFGGTTVADPFTGQRVPLSGKTMV
ncbi:hypothetical protein [Janibacter sp. G56]|uniref:hypothetical protein n=1 Tax=Janibacter sp. G56 TaxID=3418717 RepID=UPI003D005E78